MKVLALNSSPRKEGQSKTELMLTHLVKGMQEAGADVETVHLREKKIRNCSGCFSCWTKTPGICIHKDDMTNDLYPKWLQSDLVVYASPLYHFHLNASMKNFIERTLPILQPFLVEGKDHTRHPLRGKHPQMIFLSVAGFPEEVIFDQLSAWVNSVYRQPGAVVAEIYRPAAESMTQPQGREKIGDVLDATTQAGREIAESLQVSPDTMARIKQDIVEDKQLLQQVGNLFWKTCIAEGITPKEYSEKGMMPRPDSIETFLLINPMGFNPEAAADTEAVMQFNFTGEVQGSCYFEIKNGAIAAHQGSAKGPDVTIESPFETWLDIMAGKADGQQMLMAQKYKVDGDLNLLIKMGELFGR